MARVFARATAAAADRSPRGRARVPKTAPPDSLLARLTAEAEALGTAIVYGRDDDDASPVQVLVALPTMIDTFAVTAPLVAVIVAVPTPTPNSVPLELTVATEALSDDHVTGAHPVCTTLDASVGTAVSRTT